MTEREEFEAFESWFLSVYIKRGYVSSKEELREAWQARAASPKVPQGVDEWIAENGLQFVDTMGGFAVNLNRSKTCQYPHPEYVSVDDLRAYLSGMAIVPVEPTDEMVDAGYGALPDCKCTEGDKWRAKLVYKAMLAATKDSQCQS